MNTFVERLLESEPFEIKDDSTVLRLLLLLRQPEDWGYVFTHPEQFGDDGISAAHNVEDPAAAEVILLEQVHHF